MPHAASTPPAVGGLHDDQIVALLRSGAHAALLSAYFGEFEYRELCQLAKLAATRANPRGPLVLVLPGIMGSRLGSRRRQATNLLWLHPGAVSAGGLLQLALPGSRALKAVGVMLPGYLKLKLSLEIAGFAPVFFPFDWRQDLGRLGRALTRTIERSGSSRVLLIAHSMGGLVARAALAQDKKNRIARVVQLGAPNFGSFAPVQALRAVYPTVRKLAALDMQHSAEQLAQRVFLTLPGLYQLLPAHEKYPQLDFFDPGAWPQDELAPDAKLLAAAKRTRARLADADERCLLIAGSHQETITGVTRHESMFEYTIRRDGDGTVPLSLAVWPGAKTWYARENHGALVNNNSVIGATIDLLKENDTARLSTQRPTSAESPARTITDHELRQQAVAKVNWESLSIDSRRRILEPVISPEFERSDW